MNSKLIKFSSYLEKVIIFSVCPSLLIYINIITIEYLRMINSDWLQPYQIFNDVFRDGMGLSGWQFPGAPYFFPDFSLIWLLYAITRSITITTYIYNTIFIVVFLYLSYRLLLEIFADRKLALIYGLVAAISVFYLVPFDDYQFFSLRLINQSHISAVTFAIFLLFTFLRNFCSDKYSQHSITISVVLTYLLCLSDKLTIIQAVIPLGLIIIAYTWQELKTRPREKKFIMGIFIAACLAIITPKLLEITLSISFMPINLCNPKNMGIYFIKHAVPEIMGIFSRHPILISAYTICNIFTAIFVTEFWRKLLYTKSFLERESKVSTEFKVGLTLTFLLLAQLINLAISIISCKIIDNGSLRYTLTLFIFPFFSFWILFAYLGLKYQKTRLVNAVPILALLLCLIYYPVGVGKSRLHLQPQLTEPYPITAQSLDKIASTYQLKSGIANYWHTRSMELLSKSKLRINQIKEEDLSFWRIANNKNYFFTNPDTKQKPEYNFMIVNSLSKEKIEQAIAPPDLKIVAPQMEVWLFTKHEKKLNEFYNKCAAIVKSDR